MKVNIGTPKTFEQAIKNAIGDDTEKLPDSIRLHIRDFLAQKFNVAFLKVSYDEAGLKCEKILDDLWKSITGEKV